MIIFTDFNYKILFILVIRSLESYSIIFGSWSGNSNYAIFGAIRSLTQLLAYELLLILLISFPCRITQSFSLYDITYFQENSVPFFVIFPLIFIGFLIANFNRN